MIKYKIFFILLIIISFAFISTGCGISVEDTVRDVYRQNYIENNNNEPQESVANVEKKTKKEEAEQNTSKDNVRKLQVPDRYAALCGIWTSGNGASITGNVKIYGGVYTRGVLLLGNGAVINTDNGYLYRLDTTSDYNNPHIFGTICNKPFNINNVPKNVRLINVSEEELTQSEMAEIMKP